MWKWSWLTENIWFLQGSYWNWVLGTGPTRTMLERWKTEQFVSYLRDNIYCIIFFLFFFNPWKCVTVDNTVSTSNFPVCWRVAPLKPLKNLLWYSDILSFLPGLSPRSLCLYSSQYTVLSSAGLVSRTSSVWVFSKVKVTPPRNVHYC